MSSIPSPWIIAYPLNVSEVWSVDVDSRPACKHANNLFVVSAYCPDCGIKNQQYVVALKPGFTGDVKNAIIPVAFGRWECVGRVSWKTYFNTDDHATRVPIKGSVFLVLARSYDFDFLTLISNSERLAEDIKTSGAVFDPSLIVMVDPHSLPVSDTCNFETNKNTAQRITSVIQWP